MLTDYKARTPPLPTTVGYLRYLLEAAIGSALDSWGMVEARVAAIFCAAVNNENPNSASAAFAAVRGFETQVSMTTAALKETFAKETEILSEWRKISKAMDTLRKRRNQIAHGKIIFVAGSPKGVSDVRFLPFFHYHTHKDWHEFESLTQEDIEDITRAFSALQIALRAFGQSIGAKEELRKQSWQL